MTITLPGIGHLEPDDYFSKTAPRAVDFLGRELSFAVNLDHTGDAPDAPTTQAIADCIRTFSGLGWEEFSALTAPAVFAYYQQVYHEMAEEDSDYTEEYLPIINEPKDVWQHVSFGDEPLVTLRYPDERWQVAWECECAWEPEHGLAIALIGGDSEPLADSCDAIF